jgi:hypothetical protein
MFSVAAYKPYFDVDTSDVVERIWESVFPFRGTFTDKTSEKPDLYASTPFPTLPFGLGCFFGATIRMLRSESVGCIALEPAHP